MVSFHVLARRPIKPPCQLMQQLQRMMLLNCFKHMHRYCVCHSQTPKLCEGAACLPQAHIGSEIECGVHACVQSSSVVIGVVTANASCYFRVHDSLNRLVTAAFAHVVGKGGKVRRVLANRQSAQRSRIRKLQHISELEATLEALQEDVIKLTPQLNKLEAKQAGGLASTFHSALSGYCQQDAPY